MESKVSFTWRSVLDLEAEAFMATDKGRGEAVVGGVEGIALNLNLLDSGDGSGGGGLLLVLNGLICG